MLRCEHALCTRRDPPLASSLAQVSAPLPVASSGAAEKYVSNGGVSETCATSKDSKADELGSDEQFHASNCRAAASAAARKWLALRSGKSDASKYE